MADDFQSSFNSALSGLQSSSDPVASSWQAPSTTPWSNVGYTPLNLTPWSMGGSNFAGANSASSNASGGSSNGGNGAAPGTTGNNSDGSFLDNFFSGIQHSAPVQWFANTSVGKWLGQEGAGAQSMLGGMIDNAKSIAHFYQGDLQGALDNRPANAQTPGGYYSQGYNDPANAPTARQNFDRMIGGHDVPVLSMLGGFATSFADPMSVVPVGEVAKPFISAGKAGIDAFRGGAAAADTAAHAAEPVAQAAAHAPVDANLSSIFEHQPSTNDFSVHDYAQPAIAERPPMAQQGSVFDSQTGHGVGDQFAQQQGMVNPHAQPLADLQKEIADLQSAHGDLSKSLFQELNASKDEGILKQLQDAGVLRPLQNDNFYSEYKALPPSVQRLFQPGKVGQGALSMDEFAAKQGKDVPSILDALNNSKKSYTISDVAGHPALADHEQALQMLRELQDHVQTQHDAWQSHAEAAPAKGSPDVFSLAHDGNFNNLYEHLNQRPLENETVMGKSADKTVNPFTPTTPQPVRNPFKQAIGEMFAKDFGAMPEERMALNNRDAMHQLLQYQAPNEFSKLQQMFPELSHDELNQVGHIIERTAPSNPKLQPFIDAYNNVRHGGIDIGGMKFGSQAEKASFSPNGKAVLQNERDNYFRHIYSEKPEKVEQLAQKSGKSFATGASLNKERQFETLKDALDAGAHPYLNPLVAGTERMIQGGKAIIDNKMFEDLAKSGGIKKIVAGAGDAGKTSEQLSMFDHALDTKGVAYKAKDIPPGWQMSSIPQLQGWAIRPDLERALLARLGDNKMNPFWGIVQKASSLQNRITTQNSLVHGHNIAANAYLGGLNPADIARTSMRIKNGAYDEIMQRGIKAGAIADNSHGDLAASLNKRFSADNRSMLGKVKDGAGYAFHGALWDADKFLRASLFEKYTRQGMSDTEAAAKVQRNMVDYGNLTPFEQKYMKTLIPFYAWKKGNMPLQVAHWMMNTPRQMAYVHGLDAVQNSIDGKNAEDGKLDLGALPDGEHLKIDPYFAGEDPIKAFDKGVIPYLYGASNPFMKEAISQFTNHAYYPATSVAPKGMESMVKSQIYQDGAPAGEQFKSGLLHVANQFAPTSGVLGSAAGALAGAKSGRVTDLINGTQGGSIPTTPMTGTEILAKALGGFTSRSKPAMDAYYKTKDAQTQQKNSDLWQKAHGGQVSKQQLKKDFKKIPFPTGYGN